MKKENISKARDILMYHENVEDSICMLDSISGNKYSEVKMSCDGYTLTLDIKTDKELVSKVYDVVRKHYLSEKEGLEKQIELIK